MKKLILTLTLILTSVMSLSADPGCKLGEYLSTVQSEVPGLRFLRDWPSQGAQYVIYYETGVSSSYYFKNNRCVKEEFTINCDKQKANYFFNSYVSDFANQNYIRVIEGSNSVTFYFSRIQVKVSVEHFVGSEYLCKVIYTFR